MQVFQLKVIPQIFFFLCTKMLVKIETANISEELHIGSLHGW